MSKITRHQIQKTLTQIMLANFHLAKATNDTEMACIYQDIGYLAKIIKEIRKESSDAQKRNSSSSV